MVPDWLKNEDLYTPEKGSNNFILKTTQAFGGVLARLRIQRGHEKKRAIPAVVKFAALVLLIILVSVSRNRLIVLGIAACMEAYLCTWGADDILSILKPCCFAALLSFILFIPAMVMNPDGIRNNLFVVGKVFASTQMVAIFNHTTQWNHITSALRKLHIPGIFVFTIDITLKYIVLLGTLLTDLLTSMNLRSVGKNSKKHNSTGGVLGVTFIHSAEMSRQMYEAMQCRGFTDDYKGL